MTDKKKPAPKRKSTLGKSIEGAIQARKDAQLALEMPEADGAVAPTTQKAPRKASNTPAAPAQAPRLIDVPQTPSEPLSAVQTTARPISEASPLESFNTRLPGALHRRLKLQAVNEGRKIQEIVRDALQEYLERTEGQHR